VEYTVDLLFWRSYITRGAQSNRSLFDFQRSTRGKSKEQLALLTSASALLRHSCRVRCERHERTQLLAWSYALELPIALNHLV